MYLIQILLPLHDNEKQPFPAAHFNTVRTELTRRFGGVTAFVRAPAKGLWEEDDELNRDDVVMFEIIAESLGKEWWRDYRIQLQQLFKQKEVLIWATKVEKL
jgi:2-hydroxychromene-2-carboxylate isomerase